MTEQCVCRDAATTQLYKEILRKATLGEIKLRAAPSYI